MHDGSKPGLLDIVREHNSLNGLGFVVIEFSLVALAALFIALSGALHHRALISIAGAGIFVNALAVIAIAAAQIGNHDNSEGILKIRSPQFRAQIRREHPDLGKHSLLVMVSVLSPFLLVASLFLRDIKRRTSRKRL
jgi:hypothetical protein